jgi:hypothetical protein
MCLDVGVLIERVRVEIARTIWTTIIIMGTVVIKYGGYRNAMDNS